MLRYHSEKLRLRMRHDATKQAQVDFCELFIILGVPFILVLTLHTFLQIRYSAYHLAWKYGKKWIGKVRSRLQNAERRSAISSRYYDEEFLPSNNFPLSTVKNSRPWIPCPVDVPEKLLSDAFRYVTISVEV